MEGTTPHEIFALGDFSFDEGSTLPNAHIAYTTYGSLSPGRDNIVVFPTWYAGTHADLEWIIGDGNGLDTSEYFVVVPHMFGNGVSSSPSNTLAPFDRGRFPKHTIRDNVRAQHRLLTEAFDVEEIQLVIGGSMGAMQAYQWGLSYPDVVRRVLASCGAAKVSDHCYVFTRGVQAALEADAAFAGGDYEEPPTKGLKALARVWAGWGLSQRFYWDGLYRGMGYETVDDFLVNFWEAFFLSLDANDLLSQLWTWQHGDLSTTPGYDGNLERALGDITARTFVTPGERDLYFPPENSEWEVAQLPNAELHVIPGVWGHFSEVGIDAACSDFLRETVRTLLAT